MGSLCQEAHKQHAIANMDIDHNVLDDALKRAGSSWNAAQSHGLISGKLAVQGWEAGQEWLQQVQEGTDAGGSAQKESEDMLLALYQSTHQRLAERQSDFVPLLPDDTDSTLIRTRALAHWCEGYLHGLVGAPHGDALKARLAEEPLADIIKDMLQITRAIVDEDINEDDNEDAIIEIVEYLRIAAQLIYEELAELRPEAPQ